MTTSFSAVLDAAIAGADGALAASVPDDWMQGRSVFGGLQAALALRAMRALVPAGIPLRTFQATFAAPVPAGPVGARAQVLRTGKSAIQVEARLLEGERTLALFGAVFGSGRPSQVARAPQQPVVPAAEPIPFRFVPGITPNFTQFFPSRWLRGGLPFSGTPLPEAVIEASMVDDAAAATEEHVLAIADYLPPVALSMLKLPATGSTLTWMIEFLRAPAGLALRNWRLDAEMVAAADGYTSQSVRVWGPGGEPVALSRQCMVVFG